MQISREPLRGGCRKKYGGEQQYLLNGASVVRKTRFTLAEPSEHLDWKAFIMSKIWEVHNIPHLDARQLDSENKLLKEEIRSSRERVEQMEQAMREAAERERVWKDDMLQMEQRLLRERQEHERKLSEREDFWRKQVDLMVDRQSKRIILHEATMLH